MYMYGFSKVRDATSKLKERSGSLDEVSSRLLRRRFWDDAMKYKR